MTVIFIRRLGLSLGYLTRASDTNSGADLSMSFTIAEPFRALVNASASWPEGLSSPAPSPSSRKAGAATVDQLQVKEAVYAAMMCCMLGRLSSQALSLVRAVALSGLIPDSRLVHLAEKSRTARKRDTYNFDSNDDIFFDSPNDDLSIDDSDFSQPM